MMRRDSMARRALRVMHRQGWLRSKAIGDFLELASDDDSSDRNNLSSTLRRLIDEGLIDRRDAGFDGSGSRWEYRVFDDIEERLRAKAARRSESSREASAHRWSSV